MGEKQVLDRLDKAAIHDFTRAILNDIRALQLMVDQGMIEEDVRRAGVEQEMCLVTRRGCAAPRALDVMERLGDDPRFQTEVALFNLEANLGPRILGGDFLVRLEDELDEVLSEARKAAGEIDTDVVLTGILPTLGEDDVQFDSITPEPRYYRLNEASLAFQGGVITLMVDGLDRFEGKFDTVAIEGANTSLQLHLQVGAANAARLYNLAQLITAPLLAAATNSPVLMGKRVWQETRVAVFERAFDDRSASKLARGVPTRVGFGSAWLESSLLELFRDNVARYPSIMTRDLPEDPIQVLEQGGTPRLLALALHNSTVWRWNRPCFGMTGDQPHLRIENRVLPAGPTILDEVANAALFYGLMLGLDEHYGDFRHRLRFSQAKENFIASAHYGLNASFTWLDGRRVGARDLLLSELLPRARKGLKSVQVPKDHIDRYLDVIEHRVESGQTGAEWLMDALSRVARRHRAEVCRLAVQEMRRMEQGDQPVHRWAPLVPEDSAGDDDTLTLGDIMSTDVFTVAPGDLVDLATSMMEWKHIRHVPVEREDGSLAGLLSTRHLMRLQNMISSGSRSVAVEEVMNDAPLTAPPTMPVVEGMARMLAADSGCILVQRGGQLVGIVTERDMIGAAHRQLGQDVQAPC